MVQGGSIDRASFRRAFLRMPQMRERVTFWESAISWRVSSSPESPRLLAMMSCSLLESSFAIILSKYIIKILSRTVFSTLTSSAIFLCNDALLSYGTKSSDRMSWRHPKARPTIFGFRPISVAISSMDKYCPLWLAIIRNISRQTGAR